jgi:Tfp pilus assembly protein PilW
LVELLIAFSISTFVLAGVLSASLMIGRSGANAVNYSVSEREIRRALEEFSQDVRMANAVKWNSTVTSGAEKWATSVTLTVPDNYTDSANQVTYAWDGANQSFYRKPGNSASTSATTTFVTSVSELKLFSYNRQNVAASTEATTKRIQITMTVERKRATLVTANTRIVSASYMLRNKIVN